MTRIKEDIAQALSKSDCSLHAYVIMSNHLHLLISPADKEQLRKLGVRSLLLLRNQRPFRFHVTHTFMMNNSKVISQVINFLKNGFFERDVDL